MERPEHRISIGGFTLMTAGGLAMAGYPIAWLVLSPKSVLRSNDSAFVNGFGAGVAMALGALFGVTLLGFAWSQFARRFSPRRRRRLEIGLMVTFFVAALVVSAVRAAH
jgi:hypothetical protein